MNELKDIDFMEYVGKLESQYVVRLSDMKDEIYDRMESGVSEYGDGLPWNKTHEKFRLREGEVTIWAGINGHGKSMVLSHVIAHLLKDTTCLIASLEMPIAATGQRMARQMTGIESPTRDYLEKALDWTDDRLWVYDQLDSIETERIYGMVVYALKELGIKHIVIDSLMKCGVDDDDYNGQKAFVDRLCWAAKTYKGHMHLVHHIRKTKSEEEMPDKFDVLGSSALTNLVDNLVLVHRNKRKENTPDSKKGDNFDGNNYDAQLFIAKQRHGEWEGKFNLWFDKPSQQYTPGSNRAKEYFDFSDKKADMGADKARHVPKFAGDELWKL
jgi:twinkle protein